MARTDYGAILSTVIKDTSDAIREVNDTSALIAPNAWGANIRTMHSDADYETTLSYIPTKTVSGAIASFNDGAGGLNLKSLKVAITAKQSGSGNPYPAGGGKNKLDSSLLKDQIGWNNIELTLKPNTAYTMSSNIPSAKTSELPAYFVNEDTNPGSSTLVYGGHSVTITTLSTGYLRIQQRRVSGTDSFQNYQWQIEENSSATPYAPYSNIRPISGVSECNVVRCGINLWDEEWKLGSINNSDGTNVPSTVRIRSKNYIGVTPDSSICVVNTNSVAIFIYKYAYDKSYLGMVDTTGVSSGYQVVSIPSDCYYLRFRSNDNMKNYSSGIAINSPATDTSYHAYTGNTYTIQLGDTYYGGSLDVTTGVLTVTHKLVSGDIFITPQNNTAGTGTVCYILASNTDFKVPSNFCKSNILKGSSENWNNLPANSYSLSNSTYIVVCSNTPNQTRAQFIEWFNDNVQMLLELATPFTVQLTTTQIEQLLNNNVWADTGDVEELIYTDRQVYYGR